MGPDGALLFQVCRYLQPFRDFANGVLMIVMAGSGTWRHEPVPYRLPDPADADTVFIPEGEKTVTTRAALGLTATTIREGPARAAGLRAIPQG